MSCGVKSVDGQIGYYCDNAGTFEKSGLYFPFSFFVDGNTLFKGWTPLSPWERYWSEFIDSGITFNIGYMLSSHDTNNLLGAFFSKMELSALRVYSDALTDDEVKENFSKTLIFRDFLN